MGSFKFNTSGFDELEKQLKQMERNAKALEQQKEIPFSDLFTSSFMRKNTSFSSFSELLASGGFQGDTQEEFEAIPDEPFDAHIAATTKFKSWEDMLNAATDEYITKKLGF